MKTATGDVSVKGHIACWGIMDRGAVWISGGGVGSAG